MHLTYTLFLGLLAWQLFHAQSRGRIFARTRMAWTIDGISLLLHGVLVPVLQFFLALYVLPWMWPQAKGSLQVHPLIAFCINFVGIDYVYYWNHRLLHGQILWPMHRMHHSAKNLEIFLTSRNNLWATLFIVYVWINAAWIFLLANPEAFLLAAALTAGLDVWRHSSFIGGFGTRSHLLLRRFLITPHEHSLHHSNQGGRFNFGANLNWWDKMHGTYRSASVQESPDEALTIKDFILPYARN